MMSALGQNATRLFSYMCVMANTPAETYESWSADFIKDFIFDKIEVVKTEFAKETIDYKALTLDDMRLLGFRSWSDNDMLIPMWLFRLLPDDTQLYCPLAESNALVLKKDADDDYRFGCSAFALMETLPCQKGE